MEHPAEHMKLKPAHEKVIMLLGAIAGIIGLILLIKQHSAVTAGASSVSPDIATGVGSSAGGYGYSTGGGTSGGYSSGAGTSTDTGTGAASTPAPTAPTPDPVTTAPPSGSSFVNGSPPTQTFNTLGAGPATPTTATTPAAPAPASSGGGDTNHLSNFGNTTTTINEQSWSNNVTTNTNTTNIAGSFNGGNGTGSIGSSTLPAFAPNTGTGLAGYQGGSHFPIAGNGPASIVVPPPVGISQAPSSNPPAGNGLYHGDGLSGTLGGAPGTGALGHRDPTGPGLRSGVVYR